MNYQHNEDHEFFLKKLYHLYTLKPRMVIISYIDTLEYLNPFFINKLAEVNDVRVVLVKQSEKQDLIEAMTILVGKKKFRRKILDGIQVTTKIIPNSLIYSWGCASHGKLGVGSPYSLENNLDFKIACPQSSTVNFKRMVNNAMNKISSNNKLHYLNQLYTYVPQMILSNYGTPFISVACGKNHSICLSSSGKVYLWGDNSYSQLSINSKAKAEKYLGSETPKIKIKKSLKKNNSFLKSGGVYEPPYISFPTVHPKFGLYKYIESKEVLCGEFSSSVL